MSDQSPGRWRTAPLAGREGPEFPATLVGFLNAPLIGLLPFIRGPLYSQAIDHYWRSFERFDHEGLFWIQRTLPRQFRNRLAREARARSHVVEDPREVPVHLRSERWEALCRAIESWSDLPANRQVRLAGLLHALCFYGVTLRLTGHSSIRLTGPDDVLLAYWRASARYMADLPQHVSAYSIADMGDFEKIARDGRRHPVMQFLASIKLLVHEAKTRRRIGVLRAAAVRSEGLLAAAAKGPSFLRHLYTSHFNRAVAMVSQAEAKPIEVTRHMELAERHARAMVPRSAAERVLRRENLHPVLESRVKEALWRGQHERAVQLAREVISIDPYDPKSWLELGEALALNDRMQEAAEAYASAAVLGPPGSVIGLHMAGVCSHRSGSPLMAYMFFLQSVGRDPSAQSSIAHALALERSVSLPFRQGTAAWLRSVIRLD
jgi:tetratricopeptide (TPR) repeat protein